MAALRPAHPYATAAAAHTLWVHFAAGTMEEVLGMVPVQTVLGTH